MGCQKLGGKYWITKAEYFANTEKFRQTLTVIEKELASSKEEYIENFRQNYMEDNRSFVFRQLELHLLQHSEQQAEKTYSRLFRTETSSFHFLAYCACQLTKYVLSPCKGVK